MKTNKKSQITVFIIIGIILLFSTALVLYIREKVGVPEVAVKVAVEKVPTEIQPVQNYVSACIEKVSTEAIKSIGLHGGYVGTDEKDYEITLVKFNENDDDPTSADVVPFPPGSRTEVPYWAYMSSKNSCTTCTFASLQPPLYRAEGGNSIESQIDRYVSANLRKCLNNFEPFRKEGFTVNEKGNIQTTTYVRENDVVVYVDYPVELVKEQTYAMGRFSASVSVRLKALYDTANYITEMSQKSRFLGVATLNWITAFSGLDENKLPPMADYDVSFNEISWRASEVKDNLIRMLEAYVPVVQLGNTYSYRDPRGYGDPLMRGLLASMTLPQNVSTNIDAKFLYLGWPIYLDLGDENLGPQAANFPLFEIFPFKDYGFAYDLSYPAVVKLADPSAFDGRGYSFMFALETNIRANEPINASYSKFAVSFADDRNSLFCEPDQRNSGFITVLAYDASTGEPIEDVSVTFLGSQRCTIGTTKINDNPLALYYNKAVLKEKFPVGIGTLRLSKPFYVDKNMQYATAVGRDGLVEVKMDPIKTIKAKLVKLSYPANLPSQAAYTLQSALAPSEIALPDMGIVTLNKIGTEQPWASAFLLPSENETEIMLSPGEYDVSIILIYNNSITIPKAKVCHGFLGTDCEEIPEQFFGQFIYNSLIYRWEVNASDLSSGKVTFYIIAPPLPESWEDIKRNIEITSIVNSQLYYPVYRPKFENST